MNSENLKFFNSLQPDPDWDYCELLTDVLVAKSNLDEAIKYIISIEYSDHSTDCKIADKLNAIGNYLKVCVFSPEDSIEEFLEEDNNYEM